MFASKTLDDCKRLQLRVSRWDIDTMNRLMKCQPTSTIGATSWKTQSDDSGLRYCSTTGPSSWWMPLLF